MRILLAEDNRDTADSAVVLLRMLGHEVTVAGDEAQAVSILLASAGDGFDAVVADWDLSDGLPGGGGRVARLASQCGLPAAVVTGYPPDYCGGVEMLGVLFRRKPFDWPELLKALDGKGALK